MPTDPRVAQAIARVVAGECSAEDACRDCSDLLPEVLYAVQVTRAVEAELQDLFPAAESPDATISGWPSLPGYEVFSVAGSGSMGTVYKARHYGRDCLVALKVIAEPLPDEIAVVLELDHPNIVPTYDIGTHDGQHFIAMPLVEGPRLADRVPELLADQRTAARIMAQAARAVHVAHQHCILHHDLKPANILLEGPPQMPLAERVPRVADFTLARPITLKSGAMIAGTPSYMAPEQAAGVTRRLTTAIDVYGLGAVFYHLLTGRPPFKGSDTADTLMQVCQRDPEPPRRMRAGVDRDLEAICLKCLHKDPARRYHSAAALADDLDRWVAGMPIEARPVRWPTVLWKWVKRHPLAAVAIGLAATLIILRVFPLAG